MFPDNQRSDYKERLGRITFSDSYSDAISNIHNFADFENFARQVIKIDDSFVVLSRNLRIFERGIQNSPEKQKLFMAILRLISYTILYSSMYGYNAAYFYFQFLSIQFNSSKEKFPGANFQLKPLLFQLFEKIIRNFPNKIENIKKMIVKTVEGLNDDEMDLNSALSKANSFVQHKDGKTVVIQARKGDLDSNDFPVIYPNIIFDDGWFSTFEDGSYFIDLSLIHSPEIDTLLSLRSDICRLASNDNPQIGDYNRLPDLAFMRIVEKLSASNILSGVDFSLFFDEQVEA